MSVSVYVVGERDADDRFNQMIAIARQCEAAGVDTPEGVWEYFGDDLRGHTANYIEREGLQIDIPLKGRVEYGDGATIEVADIPEGVKRIRVYME